MEHISFDTFKQVDVRVGQILSVEVVPDADKLLRLMVDLGEEEPRQIISGIREFVDDPQDLVGMQTTFVTNLEPRTIRGYESNGMLFAAGGPEALTFLIPQKKVTAGATVG